MPRLTFERLRSAVAGDAVALRSRITLQPAGGDGDKVFPPSYAVDGRADHKYAVEERQLGDGGVYTTVLLDSVASQANRAELALLEGWEHGELKFPVPYVDFSEDGGEKVASEDRVFNSGDPDEVWTHESATAERDGKGRPVPASRGSASGEAGQPSKINHGNIAPSYRRPSRRSDDFQRRADHGDFLCRPAPAPVQGVRP